MSHSPNFCHLSFPASIPAPLYLKQGHWHFTEYKNILRFGKPISNAVRRTRITTEHDDLLARSFRRIVRMAGYLNMNNHSMNMASASVAPHLGSFRGCFLRLRWCSGSDVFGVAPSPNFISLQPPNQSIIASEPKFPDCKKPLCLDVTKTLSGFGEAIQIIARPREMAMLTSITLSITFPPRQSCILPPLLYVDPFSLYACLVRIAHHMLAFTNICSY
jgi:hypothetical protein